jgi:hypothetical protein
MPLVLLLKMNGKRGREFVIRASGAFLDCQGDRV